MDRSPMPSVFLDPEIVVGIIQLGLAVVGKVV